MSPWLKPRLAALFCGALFVGTALILHAQNDAPPPAKTPEEAAVNFYRLLDLARGQRTAPSRVNVDIDEATFNRLMGSIEREQFKAIEHNRNGFGEFSRLFVEGSAAPTYEAQVQSSGNNQTVVTVTPASRPRSRDVVVVKEDGGYRVDIVATYGRRNNLSGIEADKALFRETEFISPRLAAQPGFLGSATLRPCQSNQKQMMLGVIQYTQDYDERYPPARKWIDVVMPYVKSEQVFQCPALGKPGNGYAFNSKFSGVSLSSINSAAATVGVYETSNLARNVFAPFNGRAYRHTQNGASGMNIAFADGHVKWLARGKAARLTPNPAATAGFVAVSTGTP